MPFSAVESATYPLRQGNTVTGYPSGRSAFQAILDAVNSATRSVFASIAFLEPDFVFPDGRPLLQVLRSAADRGVRVCVLFWDNPDFKTGWMMRESEQRNALATFLEGCDTLAVRWHKSPSVPHCHHMKVWAIDVEGWGGVVGFGRAGVEGGRVFVGTANLQLANQTLDHVEWVRGVASGGTRGSGAAGEEGANVHDTYARIHGPAAGDVLHFCGLRWHSARVGKWGGEGALPSDEVADRIGPFGSAWKEVFLRGGRGGGGDNGGGGGGEGAAGRGESLAGGGGMEETVVEGRRRGEEGGGDAAVQVLITATAGLFGMADGQTPEDDGEKQSGEKKEDGKEREEEWFRDGESSIVAGYKGAVRAARRSIFVENQHFFYAPLLRLIREACERGVQVLCLIPGQPGGAVKDAKAKSLAVRRDGASGDAPRYHEDWMELARLGQCPNFTLAILAANDGRGGYRHIYVHSKVCVVDAQWMTTGSANTANGDGQIVDLSFDKDHTEVNIQVLGTSSCKPVLASLLTKHGAKASRSADAPERALDVGDDGVDGIEALAQLARKNAARWAAGEEIVGHVVAVDAEQYASEDYLKAFT